MGNIKFEAQSEIDPLEPANMHGFVHLPIILPVDAEIDTEHYLS